MAAPKQPNPLAPQPQPDRVPVPERRRFEQAGLLMIDPAALGLEFAVFSPAPEPFERCGDDGSIAVIGVTGPLMFVPGMWSDYGWIRRAVEAACADEGIKAIVLRANTPGGDVWGCFDAARAIRAAADRAEKRLVSFVESQACSAGYALACIADEVVMADTGVAGSIGVIATSTEFSAANERMGVRFSVITSGARKADGHPAVPITDEALAAMQGSVDAMARIFFTHVAVHRGVDAQPLQAATFVGEAAVGAGLADRVLSFDALIGELVSGEASSGELGITSASMAKAKDPIRDALVAGIADNSDKAKCARAKKALAAYDEENDPEAEGDEPEPKDEPKPDPSKAADPEPKPDASKAADEEPKPDASAPAARAAAPAASTPAVDVAAIVTQAVTAALAKERSDAAASKERAELYSAHAVNDQFKAQLDPLPLETVKGILANVPKAAGFKNPHVPKASAPVVGQGQPEGAGQIDEGTAALDAAFGRTEIKPTVTRTAHATVLSFAGGTK
jgi:ClpP class serine protease